MTDEDIKKIRKYDEIARRVLDCEEACETELHSLWSKKEETKIAYKDIRDIVLED
jgi:hypothetical protein